ncbi:hypothetical protein U6N30_10405 [Blastococcus brunescens]|uniref:Uncharacterized protein n=1 Tax=Blastococcus brunescens TaxID=1564165 RepID=A0ABZ1B7R8_9ACTN|nr:hypothetical protein [Blastococcus sp. BMG 8361]WRL65918.1 hypothetical protein U6N30_10405 [Blastococcus sp. BMG 8361]
MALLAHVAGAIESGLHRQSWRNPGTGDARWLRFLNSARLPDQVHFGRPGTHSPVPANGDEASCRHSWHPVGVQRAVWAFGDQWVADMNGVRTSGGESLAEPERALVHVEAQTFAIGHHETSGGRAL